MVSYNYPSCQISKVAHFHEFRAITLLYFGYRFYLLLVLSILIFGDMEFSLPLGPSALMLNLSALAYLLGVTILAWCITRCNKRYPMNSWQHWAAMPWSRIWLLSTLIVSWLYLIFSTSLFSDQSNLSDSLIISWDSFIWSPTRT